MTTRVVITGMGCVSPLGNNVQSTWETAVAGKSGVGPITLFDAKDFETRFAAEVKGFDPVALFGRKEARRMDRYTQFAVAATREALADAHLEINDENRERIGVYIGTGIGGISTLLAEVEVFREKGPRRVSPFLVPMMLPDTAGAQVGILFGMRGPNLGINAACATGSNTIGEAAEVIRRGAADVMLAGGSEASIVPLAVAGFSVMGATSTRNDAPEKASRPFDKDRDGFVVGEGGAVVVLESEEYAKARGAHIYGEVLGYGITNDAHHISAPLENGEGAVARMQSILVAHPGSELDVGGRVILKAPRTRAEIIARTITTGGHSIARGHLVGLAPEIKAHLECRGLILGKGTVYAVPELEGRVAGVDMSHEAAVGKIAMEEVEYLMARGLDEEEAVSTIVRGFLKVKIEGLPEALEEEMDRVILETGKGL